MHLRRSLELIVRSKSLWPQIHPAEVFPLIISLAVIIQSSIFIGVQSGALGKIFANECRRTAELVWPGRYREIE